MTTLIDPNQLEDLFKSSQLELFIPDGVYDLPASLTGEQTVELLNDLRNNWKMRDVALFDERLQLILAVLWPVSKTRWQKEAGAEDNDNPPIPLELATLIPHLQVTLDVSYVPPPGPPKPPHLDIASPRPPSMQNQSPSRPGLGLGPVSIQPPMTPNPLPVNDSPGNPYSSPRPNESGTPVHSYVWGEVGESDAPERKFTLLWHPDTEGGSWVAFYKIDVPVVYVQTWFPNPRLSLMTSITLRDRRLPPTPVRDEVLQVLQDYLPTGAAMPMSPQSLKGAPHPVEEDEENDFEEVNLLEGISLAPSFQDKAQDSRLFLPASRLAPPSRSSISPRFRHGGMTSSASLSSVSRLPVSTLRKSYRKTLAAVSGIKVRMRTTFVPYFIFPGSLNSDELDERRDAGNEEKTVMICVEVENVPDSGRGFLVEKVDVTVGGEGAKSQLVGWGDALGDGKGETVFPLKLKGADMYSLLYAVSFMSPDGDAGANGWMGLNGKPPDTHRPMSIVIAGRPWDPDSDDEGRDLPPTEAFSSRWSSMLDFVAAAASSDPLERPVSPLSDKDTLPMPSSPFPASPSTTRLNSPIAKTPPTVTSPVAGSKRHTIAGLAQRSSQLGLTKKLFNRASTPLPPHPPKPQTPPPPVPPIPQLNHPYTSPHTTPKKASPLSISVPTSPNKGPPLVTPAFPSYAAAEAMVPPSPMSHSPLSVKTTSGPIVVPNRHKQPESATQPVPPSRVSLPPQPQAQVPDDEVFLVSVSLVRPDDEEGDDSIYPLSKFVLEVFVFNKSSRARRCEISYPDRKRWRKEHQARMSAGQNSARRDSKVHPAFEASTVAGVVPLENNIQLGTLDPDSCQSVRMQFMALQPGIHTIDALTLKDLDSGDAKNLRSVMHVVVRERPEIT